MSCTGIVVGGPMAGELVTQQMPWMETTRASEPSVRAWTEDLLPMEFITLVRDSYKYDRWVFPWPDSGHFFEMGFFIMISSDHVTREDAMHAITDILGFVMGMIFLSLGTDHRTISGVEVRYDVRAVAPRAH